MGLVLAYWGMALMLGRPLVSQTDFDYVKNGSGVYGSRAEPHHRWSSRKACASGGCPFT